MASLPPLSVVVTGAAGAIGYSLMPMIASGQMFGEGRKIDLRLLEIPAALDRLQGTVMEIDDGAFNLAKLTATADVEVAFKDVDIAIFVGGFPRKAGMERKDIQINARIFVSQAKALEDFAKKTVKVLVVANPANTNCLSLMIGAPSIPRENFSCLSRLDLNRSRSQLCQKYRELHPESDVTAGEIVNAMVWGNHSSTQYPDVSHCVIQTAEGPVKARDAFDDAWLDGDFMSSVQKRGGAIIKARGASSAMSAANAACNHMRDWIVGTDECVSMGVCSDGNPYGIPEGLIYSFPVTCEDGKWKIVPGLPIDDRSKGLMLASAAELVKERDSVNEMLSAPAAAE